jgi:hypothetical protein
MLINTSIELSLVPDCKQKNRQLVNSNHATFCSLFCEAPFANKIN